jgi:hypothetical protein
MADADDDNDQLLLLIGVDNPVSAHSDTVPILLSSKLLATSRPRMMGQRLNPGHDALPVLLLINGLDLPGRR